MVPITPKLIKVLQNAFDAAEPGQEHLVAIRGKGAAIRKVRTICQTAGVEPWPRLWRTRRSSCEKEWAMVAPQFAVSKWIGHSITVSGKHYANAVIEKLFDKITGSLTQQQGDAGKAARNSAQHPAESQRTDSQTPPDEEPPKSENPRICGGLHFDAAICEESSQWSRGGELNPAAWRY